MRHERGDGVGVQGHRAGRLRLGLASLAVTWGLTLAAAPAVLAGHADGRGGAVTLVATLPYAIGAQVCHQRPERSFHWHGVPWPVCGRCAGLYLAGAVGMVLAAAAPRRWRGDLPLSPVRAILALAAAPTFVTWSLEVAGLWNPGTPLRALAAVPLGLAIGWTLDRAARGPLTTR